ncbi:MAG: hypothetical protein HYX90_02720 [Chloroflexi bacterium]|nr:hypothetical protein [Chloroflexota bacterium]
MARVYARYLPNHLPGKPTMVVRNMPGGAGTISANYAYSAKADGLTLFAGQGGTQLNQLVGIKAVRFDLLKMPALLSSPSGSLFYMKAGVINRPEDLLQAKGIIYGSSSSSPGYLFVGAKELLNIPTEKVILAYSGSGDARRAFLAGEINMGHDSAQAYFETTSAYVQKGEIMPLFQTGLLDDKREIVKSPDLPREMLTIKELYEKLYNKSPSGMAWEAFKGMVAAVRNYDSVLFLSPGVPENVVKVYWEAAQTLVKDPEFRKVVDPLMGGAAVWITGEACDKQFKLNFAIRPEVRDWLRDTLPRYGMVVE